MKVVLISILLTGVLLMISDSLATSAENERRKAEMRRLLSPKVDDYRLDRKVEFYDRQTAFRYMDGAAELYRAYAFKLLMVRKYVKKDHPSILVELFDMGSSEDAFGIFSYQTGEEEVGIGQASDYGGGLLRFWKGDFFVNVFAERETPMTRGDILTIGRSIANNIKKEGPLPKLIQFLPKEGLVQKTLRYFHLHHVLNHHYFLSHENILGLGMNSKAILATYLFSEEEEKTYLLLIQYPDQRQAERGFKAFVKTFMPEAQTPKIVQMENGKWSYASLHPRYVLIVFDAPTRERAETLIESTGRNLKRRSP